MPVLVESCTDSRQSPRGLSYAVSILHSAERESGVSTCLQQGGRGEVRAGLVLRELLKEKAQSSWKGGLMKGSTGRGDGFLPQEHVFMSDTVGGA